MTATILSLAAVFHLAFFYMICRCCMAAKRGDEIQSEALK